MAIKRFNSTQARFVNCGFSAGPLLIRASFLSLLWLGLPLAGWGAAPWAAERSAPQLAQASPEFSDVGRPRRRQGGGSRGSCLIADKPPLTALVPSSGTGLTLAQSPSFWFYLPYDLTERHSVEFVLKDSQDNLVHRKTIDGEQTASGILNLRLPASVVLEANQSYEWYLLVQCDAANPERFVFVNGAVQRLERPELQQQLAGLSPEAQANLYRAENFWYDALDTVAVQLQNAPRDSKSRREWQAILQSIGLVDLESQPLVACCTAE